MLLTAVMAGSMTMAPILAPSGCEDRDELPFSKAKIIIEFNDSAQDVGIQVLLDGEPWQWVKAFDPRGRKILNILGQRSLGKQGLTELFFEGSEPSLDDLPLDDFLARFPEGEYEFEGLTVDRIILKGTAVLSHAIPAGPEILEPISFTDDPPVVDPHHLVIEWEPVVESIHGPDVEIAGYQVIVEQVDPLRIFSIDVPASVTSVVIPAEFFEQPNTLHKFEVLAVEVSGNQTITEGSFVTMP